MHAASLPKHKNEASRFSLLTTLFKSLHGRDQHQLASPAIEAISPPPRHLPRRLTPCTPSAHNHHHHHHHHHHERQQLNRVGDPAEERDKTKAQILPESKTKIPKPHDDLNTLPLAQLPTRSSACFRPRWSAQCIVNKLFRPRDPNSCGEWILYTYPACN
jgi:hypothetical protein